MDFLSKIVIAQVQCVARLSRIKTNMNIEIPFTTFVDKLSDKRQFTGFVQKMNSLAKWYNEFSICFNQV